MKKGWDRGLSFEDARVILAREWERLNRSLPDKRGNRQFTYLMVLYVQLVNGCRVGEAVEALREYAKSGNREVYVRVEKRGDNKHRLVVIPELVGRVGINISDLKTANVKVYAQRLGINTHSLRYAFITEKAKEGVNPAVIAKITGHKNLNTLLHYIQEREAEAVLEKSVNGNITFTSSEGERVR